MYSLYTPRSQSSSIFFHHFFYSFSVSRRCIFLFFSRNQITKQNYFNFYTRIKRNSFCARPDFSLSFLSFESSDSELTIMDNDFWWFLYFFLFFLLPQLSGLQNMPRIRQIVKVKHSYINIHSSAKRMCAREGKSQSSTPKLRRCRWWWKRKLFDKFFFFACWNASWLWHHLENFWTSLFRKNANLCLFRGVRERERGKGISHVHE